MIKIYSEIDLKDRLVKTDSIEKTNKDIYCEGAYIPKGKYSKLSKKQYDKIVYSKDQHSQRKYSDISVISIDGSYIDALNKIGEEFYFGRNVDDKYYENNLKCLLQELLLKVEIDGEPILTGFNTTIGCCKTTTWDPEEKNKPGLHIDSWEHEEIRKRERSKNRVCINLSSTDRYFLFYNIGIDKIKLDYFGSNVNELVIDFLSKNKSIPLYGIRLKKGEAYIAPTEYIIHDGFVPSGQLNTTLTIRGRIKVREGNE